MPVPRLSPRVALVALVAIAAAGAGVVSFAVTHRPTEPTTFASSHSHDGRSTGETVTAEERARAEQLVAATGAALGEYSEVAAAEASGYQWIGDDGGDYRHYVRAEYLVDGLELDPGHIESLVYRVEGDGLRLVSGMYILSPGTTTAEAPDVGGPLTPWHVHMNLCFEGSGSIAGTDDDGSCPAGSFNLVTPPMLHVWVVDNPDGPFAAVDENGIVSAEH